MKNIYKIQLIGVGGQGTVKASTIVGEAAMKKGLNVVMSEVHGMAQRGGKEGIKRIKKGIEKISSR